MATNIIILGSLNGEFRTSFAMLEKLVAKKGFALAILTGNVFSEGQEDQQLIDLLGGKIPIACPTYFTVGTTTLPADIIEKIEGSGGEIAPNLHYLPKRSTFKTSEGVRIVTLGGIEDSNIVGGLSKEQHLPYYTEGDAKSLQGVQDTDVLLTSVWPANVWQNSPKAQGLEVDFSTLPSSKAIANLCAALKPRYHFSTSPTGEYFEREPFFPDTNPEDQSKGIPITRFVSLAPWGKAGKNSKSMMGFKINRSAIATAPQGSTRSPFQQTAPTQKGKRTADEAGFSRFGGSGNDDNRHPHKSRREQRPPRPGSDLPGPEKCFLCLGSKCLTAHLVCAVAEESYLATAKGPLPSESTFAQQGLNFPCNLLITPLEHVATLSARPEGTDFAPDAPAKKMSSPFTLGKTLGEMTRFRKALQGMVAGISNRSLGAVTWEISRERNVHLHWQFMPIPAEMVTEGTVEAGFRVLAQDMGLGTFKTVDEFGGADEVPGGPSDYLRVWIWADSEEQDQVLEQCLLLKFDDQIRFDLQFPRKVMAKLLGLWERIDWKTIEQSEEGEKLDVMNFRNAFQGWDFT